MQMEKPSVILALLEPDDREQFILDNQEAFLYGATQEFGMQANHFEEEGEIIGYSYADRLRPRAAFEWDVEMTIYLKQDIRRSGLGRHMYTLMEDILREQGVVNAVSLITKPTDEYSDFNSVQFHEKMGYKHAGELKDCGYKFNRWYALLYMDKQIGIPQEEMPPIRDFDEVREKFGL